MPFSTTYFWLGLMVLMIVVELIVPGLVSIWFAAGALFAILPSVLGGPVWLQIIVFLVVSVAALLVTRPIAKKYINSRTQPTNADIVIGKECIIVQDIDNIQGKGAAKVNGKEWTARSSSDHLKLSKGTHAKVLKIDGVKLIVEPINSEEK